MGTLDYSKEEVVIGRREFIQKSSAAAIALALLNRGSRVEARDDSTGVLGLSQSRNKIPMGIVVHSYAARWNSKLESSRYPGFANAMDLLEHAHSIGAGGIQVGVSNWSVDFSKKFRERLDVLGMYLEGSIGLPQSPDDLKKFEQDIANAGAAGARVIRTVASTGRRYEVLHSEEEFEKSMADAVKGLQLAEPILGKYKVRIAVENHKDWLAAELAKMIRKLGSDWIGVTLDFGNSMALLEDPLDVAKTLAPYALSTHVKDMAVEEYKDGFLLSEVPLGKGILDLPAMVKLCSKHNQQIFLSLEMITRDPLQIPCLRDEYWKTMNRTKRSDDLNRMMEIVRKKPFAGGLPRVSALTTEERLANEEDNILASLSYSHASLETK